MSSWKSTVRSLLRRPSFTVTTVAVLGLGVGANSALFSVFDAVLLKPLPYPGADRIVFLLDASPGRTERESLLSPARLQDYNRRSRAFDVISGMYSENVTDTSQSMPERLPGRRVAPGFFSVFRMDPLTGRTFTPDEERSGGPLAAVISEGLWERRYGRDRGAVGKRLIVGATAYTIVGVMPRTFSAPGIDVWMPAQLAPQLMTMRDARFLSGVGRMKPGVTIAQAEADLNRVAEDLGREFGKTDANWSALVKDYKQERVGSNARSVATMFAATILLLLILCANVAGLLLGQFQTREREFAIRASLGGDTRQIAGVVMREIAVIAASSGVVGLLIAYWGTAVLSRVFADLPRMQEVRFDWRIVSFTLAATLATAVICGVIPAIQVFRRDLNAALAQGGRSQAGGKRRTQQVLVAAQFTITVVLLVGAGLLLRSYYNLTRVSTGFRADNVITFHVGAGWGEDRAKVGLMQQQILSQLQNTPGVLAAGVTNFLPASGATLREQVTLEGTADVGDSGKITVGTRMVSEGYLRALGFPLLRGSLCPAFNPDPKQPATALVNRRFVDAAGGVDVIGRKVTFSNVGERPFEISGIIGDAKEDALNATEVPYLYLCMWAGAWPDPEYAVSVNGDSRALMRAIPEIVHRLAPDRAVFGMQPLGQVLDRTLDRPRLNAGVLAVFAASALLSAALGLYGLMTLVVTGRTREIGVRMAVGATPARIIAQVLAEALRPLIFAVLAGWGLSLLAVRAFRSILFGVPETDLITYGGVCVLLMTVAAISALIPGRRAATIDPVEALRTE